ncbi:hypothetical protein B0H14DRAFT_2815572 [Mycena olivaceomarginata]|nr:hypothetical protein B0H14DRAFT_2889920 [Mycena olivaceomarginata]KAJ7827128.1 hypothetical protein B0H14DRAFT_2815572 [Mycena olivaceomarginata]
MPCQRGVPFLIPLCFLMMATASLARSRECAICPEDIVEPEKQVSTLRLREAQRDNVVCGIAANGEEKRMDCTYNVRDDFTEEGLMSVVSGHGRENPEQFA